MSKCLTCGGIDTITPTTQPRTITYRGIAVRLPAMDLPECSFCHDMLLDENQADIYSDILDDAYISEVRHLIKTR